MSRFLLVMDCGVERLESRLYWHAVLDFIIIILSSLNICLCYVVLCSLAVTCSSQSTNVVTLRCAQLVLA